MEDRKKIEEILSRGVISMIDEASIREKFRRRKPLRIKYGVDPTTARLHLGHLAIFRKLRALQELGNTVIFLVGDFTARFGDPTGRLEARPLRTKREVRAAAKHYARTAKRFLDPRRLSVRYNSAWYDRMGAEELLKLMSYFTLAQVIERDMFQERIRQGFPIRLHEMPYQILQGYDSVMIQSDLTVIGSDQIYNELQARVLQKVFHQEPQDVIAIDMLVGLDGKEKMSQSLRNDIGVDEPPAEVYGKIMSLPDGAMPHYATLLTDMDEKEIAGMEREIEKRGKELKEYKKKLAYLITKEIWGEKESGEAQMHFVRLFEKGEIAEGVSVITVKRGEPLHPLEFLVAHGLAPSKTEAKRLLEAKAVEVNEEVVTDWRAPWRFHADGAIRVGKRKFLRVKVR